MRWVAWLIFLGCVSTLAGSPTAHAKRARPPTQSELIGTWQGYSDSQLEFAVLELDAGGVGLLAISYLPDDAPLLYKVEKWAVRDFDIEATVRPIDAAAEVIELSKIHFELTSLYVELTGASWKRTLRLFNAKEYKLREHAASVRIQSARHAQN
jgi:hypothetical protein